MIRPRPRRRRGLALALLLAGCRGGEDGRGIDEDGRAYVAPCTNADVPSPPDVKGACPANGRVGEAATDAERYRVHLIDGVDGCGVPGWGVSQVEPATPLSLSYGGSMVRGLLGDRDLPVRLGALQVSSEELSGRRDGQSVSLATTVRMSSGEGCEADWQVSLRGLVSFEGFEGEMTYHLRARSPGVACAMPANCSVLQLVSGVRVSDGSSGDPDHGSGGARQYE